MRGKVVRMNGVPIFMTGPCIIHIVGFRQQVAYQSHFRLGKGYDPGSFWIKHAFHMKIIFGLLDLDA